MRKKISLLIIAVFVVIIGVVGQNIIGNYYSQSTSLNSQTAASVVYIENGVTGVVTINDPVLNRSIDINVIYAPLDSGSGFIVNNQGYIITAFHVVGDPETLKNQMVIRLMNSTDIKKYIERAAVAGYVSKYNPQLGSELMNTNSTGSPPIIQAQPDINTTTDMLDQNNLITVGSSQQQIRVKLPGTTSTNAVNANLVDVGNSGTDDDVALIKIDPFLKTLTPLAVNSKTPIIGENIQIYGYPVLNGGMYSDTNQTTIKPSSTTGVLTAEVPNNGSIYYQTNALASHGYSGGPVVDSQNSVLGILIYSIESMQQVNQTATPTSSLFLSSQYIIQICNKNNVSIQTV
jgi:S1-C subfamily serine protease